MAKLEKCHKKRQEDEGKNFSYIYYRTFDRYIYDHLLISKMINVDLGHCFIVYSDFLLFLCLV